MDTTRSPRTASDRTDLLLAGPDRWREEVRPAFAGSDAFSVRTAETADRAVATATESRGTVDCVVGARRVGETAGLELLSRLRSRGVDAPFVLAPTDGDESLAAEALDAGVDDYVPARADPAVLRRRCREAVEGSAAERRRRQRADQFEALFAAPDQFVAVLEKDGTVVRANGTALGFLDADEEAVLGKRFWGLPWTDDSARPLQRAVRRARRGEYAEFEAGLRSDVEHRFEFAVRPVTDDAGEVVRLVAEGREVAERVRLEEELRESEELHRVTLNNMTDTVLVTDDEGAFTYVCPNVHFIFGYSAEEIYDLGTIDALLGEDLFDRDRLDAESVLTNVECTATDKDGREHTLLVNVRRVSIQGGTTLFSCRDITKRKQRERALTRLHRTSRDLLYAETKPEIADRVASDAAAILPSAAAAVYRFDSEQNVLYPAAVTDELEARLGTPPDLRLDRETAVGRAFVDGETRTRADGSVDRTDGREAFPATLGEYVAVPLGDHGVLVAVADGEDSFDEVGGEVTELLAATTEAAFDRVARESELRERDRELQARNRRLTQLNRVNEFIREIDQALVGAESRERIENAVCERLTADDRFAFAWIGEATAPGRSLSPRAWAGDDRGYLDAVRLDAGPDAESAEPSVRAAEEREATLVSNVADRLRADPWCREAVSRDFQSALSIPLTYDGVLFGTLSVYADRPDAFDEMVRSVLRELGDTVASAINAVQRKEALESDAVVELEYRSEDPSAVLHRLAAETGTSLTVEGDVVRDDDTTLVFATVDGGAGGEGPEGTDRSRLDDVVATAEGLVDVASAEAIRESEDGGLVGLRLRGDFVATVLADHGAALDRLRATPEGLSLTLVAPRSVGTRAIDEVVSNTYEGADLVAQRERTRPAAGARRSEQFLDDLTDRQLEVARMAYRVGFFDDDRDVTGRDVASMLDVSHTAFYDHVRRVQRKLFATLFDSRPRPMDVE